MLADKQKYYAGLEKAFRVMELLSARGITLSLEGSLIKVYPKQTSENALLDILENKPFIVEILKHEDDYFWKRVTSDAIRELKAWRKYHDDCFCRKSIEKGIHTKMLDAQKKTTENAAVSFFDEINNLLK